MAACAPSVIPLRPLGDAEILDGGVRLVRRHARAAFALSVPVAEVRAAIVLAGDLLGEQRSARDALRRIGRRWLLLAGVKRPAAPTGAWHCAGTPAEIN